MISYGRSPDRKVVGINTNEKLYMHKKYLISLVFIKLLITYIQEQQYKGPLSCSHCSIFMALISVVDKCWDKIQA